MAEGLGRVYADGEAVVRQGEDGSCMYVIQSGRAEVVKEEAGRAVALGVLEEGDVFGEMAIFDREVRSATVRALGEARILTVDRKTFLRRVHEDPSLAFNILQAMSKRVRRLDAQVVELQGRLSASAPKPAAAPECAP